MNDCRHGEFPPQEGTWTLTAPDGRQWQAESGLLAAAKEQCERIPPEVQLARIMEGIEPTEYERDAERYRWLRDNPQWLGYDADYRPDQIDAVVDHAMTQTPNNEVSGAASPRPT